MATDELVLARSLGATFSRDSHGHIEQPERLYASYAVESGAHRVACAFRDHVLSDLIGFTYAGWAADAAADDFVGRLVEAGARYRRRSGGDAVIPIILDGENAWEHFEGGGRPFLRALYGRLSGHPELRTVTLAEACRTPQHHLSGIFPGSWIDANFSIWIGHADDQRAWSQLADARDALESASSAAARDEAFEELLIAEGSDWFWWYGDDHSSAHDLTFDDLFRRHVRNAYRALQKPVPDELFASNISTGGSVAVQTDPIALLAPVFDGEETSYFEWLGAGAFEVHEVAGAMHRSDRPPTLLRVIQFGFDREHLLVRIDADRPLVDLLAGGREVSLKFLKPEGVRFSVRQMFGRLSGAFWDRTPSVPLWVERGAGGATLAVGSILELALPLRELQVTDGQPLAFFVAVYLADAETERHPEHRPIEVTVPDALFEARQWRT
jgi:hypothetical protein